MEHPLRNGVVKEEGIRRAAGRLITSGPHACRSVPAPMAGERQTQQMALK
jgi:hypothetical protein